ncbi:NADH dehydrogenase [Amycolatopsis xylanica]|uniref:NADH dehydrogenase n=1 Tax=Amycolatopsis xylanica TaxID=589385 RepID=A0A1H3GYK3_9PSEU|nr:FAD-dependent oxidoreductase [Amycolatopsis xylanica]SDY08403.1 NADH dehydrogenase [Amycolatopsis xylanica]
MADLVIAGGGFAGLWSAMAASRLAAEARLPLDVLLVSTGPDLVIRPRLYEADPARMRVPLDDVLGPLGVRREQAAVTGVNLADQCVELVFADGRSEWEPFRRLVVATGSDVRRPVFEGAELVHDVDTLGGATALDAHLRELSSGEYTAVVAGSGFTGVEVACELVSRLKAVAGGEPVKVCLVELADRLSPRLGSGPREVISAALGSLGVEVLLGTGIRRVTPGAVMLSDGAVIEAHTVVWTAGVAASPLAAKVGGSLDALGRLHVDRHLRVPEAPSVFAAGDVAAAETGDGHVTLPSCQHAIPLGKRAGHNAAAELLGLPVTPFTAEPYATCLDLGPAGALLSTGWERTVVLTGPDAKTLKRTINEQRIYPPTGDREAILAAADPDHTWVPKGS